jgi:phage FluMu gp28-like protein
LPPELLVSVGEDFGRVSDLTVIVPMAVGVDLVRRVPFMVELGNMPFEQQRQVLFYICDRLARFHVGALDKGGNGAYLAEVATQHYGARIHEIQFNEGWYRDHMPPLKAAFEDGDLEIPKDAHVLDDLRAIKLVNGVARLPNSTGQQNRHGDAAIALALAYYATRQDGVEIDYRSTGIQRSGYEAGRLNADVGWGAVGGSMDTGSF